MIFVVITFYSVLLSIQVDYVNAYSIIDSKNKTTKLVRVPKFSEIPYPTVMEPKLVIEYYSR